MTRPDPTGPDPPQRPSREQAAGGDQRPSPGLQVAAMLARAGWSAERLVRAFGLPPAFAEALHRDAIATGERRPGDDARLADALRQLQEPQRQTRTSRSRLPPTSGPAPQPPGDRPGPGGRRRRRARWPLRLGATVAVLCLITTLALTRTPHPLAVGLVLLVVSALCLTAITAQARTLNARTREHRRDR